MSLVAFVVSDGRGEKSETRRQIRARSSSTLRPRTDGATKSGRWISGKCRADSTRLARSRVARFFPPAPPKPCLAYRPRSPALSVRRAHHQPRRNQRLERCSLPRDRRCWRGRLCNPCHSPHARLKPYYHYPFWAQRHRHRLRLYCNKSDIGRSVPSISRRSANANASMGSLRGRRASAGARFWRGGRRRGGRICRIE